MVMGLSRKKLLLIGAVLVVGALMFGVIPLSLLEISVNTNGTAYRYYAVEGNSNANGGGDILLSGESLVTSWTGGGASEPMLIQGQLRRHIEWDVPLGVGVSAYWYIVSVSGDNQDIKINGGAGTDWTSTKYGSVPFSSTDENWVPLKAVTVTITNPVSGSVTVQLWAHHTWLGGIGGLQPQSRDDLFAEDFAYLRSGVGSVKVQNDVVEENTNAAFFVETGYAHSTRADVPTNDQGWILNVYNPTGTSVFQKNIDDNFAGTITWLVPSGSYSSTSSNIFKVVLRNELINQDDTWMFAIGAGMMKDIPKLPSFTITSGDPPYHPGDQITVRISSDKGTNPIAGFWVWVSYETSAGTTTQYIYEKKWYPATVTATGGTATVTFTFPDTGYARLEASCADTLNLNSGMSSMKWTINGSEGGASYPFDWTQLVYVIVALIGAVVVWFKVPLPKMFKIIVVLVLIAVAFYFAWPLVTTDYSVGATWIPGGLR
jgi:hypothetical protein